MRFTLKIMLVMWFLSPVCVLAEPRVANPFLGLENEATLVSAATASVLRRMVFPVTNSGEDKPHSERLFSTLAAHFQQTSAEAELIVGAGPAGDALAYVQQRLWDAREADPNSDAKAVLRAVISETSDIPAQEVMGVGSDLDFLLRAPSQQYGTLVDYVTKRTRGTAEAFSPEKYDTAVEDVVFAKEDVKSFNSQMQLATKQGGASVDHMSFSLTRGTFLDPPGSRLATPLLEEFLKGRLHHFGPVGESEKFSANKQVARTVRVMTKFPWMQVVDESILRQDLAAMSRDTADGKPEDERVTKQLLKITRNGRASNGDNRFHESLKESRGKKDKPLEAAILDVIQSMEARYGQSYMPRVAPIRTLHQRSEMPLAPGQIPTRKFFLNHTSGTGWVYYAIPTPEHALGVMRGNFVVSRLQNESGTDGQGVHLTPNLQEAQRLAGPKGLIVKVQFTKDGFEKLRVVDLKQLKKDPEYGSYVQKAALAGEHPFEWVAKHLGLDAVVDGDDIWVQNARAMQPVTQLKEIIEAYGRVIDNPHSNPYERLTAAVTYEQLHQYAQSVGESVTPPRISQLLDELARSRSLDDNEALLSNLPYLAQLGMRFESRELRDFILRQLAHTGGFNSWRASAVSGALALPLGPEDLRLFVFTALQDPHHEVQAAGAITIARYAHLNPDIKLDPALQAALLKTAATADRATTRETAWTALAHARLSDNQIYAFFAGEMAKSGQSPKDALDGIIAYTLEKRTPLPAGYLKILVQAALASEASAEKMEALFQGDPSMRLFTNAFATLGASARKRAFDALALVDISQTDLVDILRGFARNQKGRSQVLKTLAALAAHRGEKLTGESRAFVENIELDTDIKTRIAALAAAKQTDMTPEQVKALQQQVFFGAEFLDPSIDWEVVRSQSPEMRRIVTARSLNFKRQFGELHQAVGGDSFANNVDPDLRAALEDLFSSKDKKTRRQALEHYGKLFFNFSFSDHDLNNPTGLSARMLEMILPAALKASPEAQIDIYEYINRESEKYSNAASEAPTDQHQNRQFRWVTTDGHGFIMKSAMAAAKVKNERLRAAASHFLFNTSAFGHDGRVELVLWMLKDESAVVREKGIQLTRSFTEQHPRIVEALNVATKDSHGPVRKSAQTALTETQRLPMFVDEESERERMWAEEERQLNRSMGGVLSDLMGTITSLEDSGQIGASGRAGMLRYFIGDYTAKSMTPELQQSIIGLLNDSKSDDEAIRQLTAALRNSEHYETDLATTRDLVRALSRPEVRRVLTQNGQIPFNKILPACLVGLKAMADSKK
jgi:hypothetical protein